MVGWKRRLASGSVTEAIGRRALDNRCKTQPIEGMLGWAQMENESVQRFTGKKGYVTKDVRSADCADCVILHRPFNSGRVYNAATSFSCGIVVSIIGAIACFAKGGRKDRLPVTVVLLFGIALAYLVSMCVNGITVTTLSLKLGLGSLLRIRLVCELSEQ